MMIKTTKQIVEDFIKEFDIYIMGDRTVAYPLVTDEKGLEQINRVWVCLDDLKKEIKEMIELNNLEAKNQMFVKGFNSALVQLQLLLLCNSQEQKGDERK